MQLATCSQKRDPEAQWAARWLLPSIQSGSGAARADPRFRASSHSAGAPRAGQGMNREGAPGKSPEETYIQQKVRVLLMLRKMGSNVSAFGVPRSSPREGA